MDGVIVVDKPSGWTSHDVVNKMRRIAGTRKVGHLGTLDPLATGVLPLVIGRATRLAQFFTLNQKTYEGTIHFGFSTDSYDGDGTPTSPELPITLDRNTLDPLLEEFRGELLQVPPAVSAKKIAGRPAYELARKSLPVNLPAVQVHVHELVVLDISENEASVRVRCSAGTYIRSIAHDAGQKMGCGAFLKALRRTASGDFTIAQSRTLETLEQMSAEHRLDEALIPAAQLLPEMPAHVADDETVAQIKNGRDFAVSPFQIAAGTRLVKVLTRQGQLVAVGEAKFSHLFHPLLVM